MSEQSEDLRTSIFEELNQLSFKRQQVMDRRSVVDMLIEFKKNNGQNEQEYSKDSNELLKLDEMLQELSERKMKLETQLEQLNPQSVIGSPSSGVVFVVNPPSVPAPRVILDLGEFPRHSCKTQCPFCHQYITTETRTEVGSVSYLMCFICIIFCCFAGCCLIPLCMDYFKDVIHKCPKCRSHITRCKKF